MTAVPVPPVGAAPRNRTFDVAKGIAIIAVVASHVMRGAHNDGLIAATATYNLFDVTLYLFHVQLFLLISGYLAFPRASDRRAQRNRQISLAYAYFLWSGLSLAAMIATHDQLPAPGILRSILSLFYAPIQHFWFLPIIMIGYALLSVLRSRIALVAGIAISLAIPTLLGFSYYGVHYYLPFYLAGALLRTVSPGQGDKGWLTGISVALFVAGIAVALRFDLIPPTIAMMIPFSLAACHAVYRAAGVLSRHEPIARWLEGAGQASLPIFLTHIFFTAGVRRVSVMLLGPVDPALLLSLSLCAGVAGPILLDRFAGRLHARRLAGFEPLLR